MSATITNMDYRVVDILNSNQLEPGDLIGLGEEIIEIVSISSLPNGFLLTFENDFYELDEVEISDDDTFELYILD